MLDGAWQSYVTILVATAAIYVPCNPPRQMEYNGSPFPFPRSLLSCFLLSAIIPPRILVNRTFPSLTISNVFRPSKLYYIYMPIASREKSRIPEKDEFSLIFVRRIMFVTKLWNLKIMRGKDYIDERKPFWDFSVAIIRAIINRYGFELSGRIFGKEKKYSSRENPDRTMNRQVDDDRVWEGRGIEPWRSRFVVRSRILVSGSGGSAA